MSDKSILIRELKSNIFQRIAFISERKYFVSADGRILSLNSGEPKLIDLRFDVSGVAYVTLYVPNLRSFEVSELILRVFKGEPDNNDLRPEYLNGNTHDCFLQNLKWGGSQSTINLESVSSIEQAERLVNSRNGNVAETTYLVNSPLKNEITNTLFQLIRLLLQENLKEEDSLLLSEFIDELTVIANTNVIAIDNFQKAIPLELTNTNLDFIVKELKRNVENNISLYGVL